MSELRESLENPVKRNVCIKSGYDLYLLLIQKSYETYKAPIYVEVSVWAYHKSF